jgi:uncharacterized protein
MPRAVVAYSGGVDSAFLLRVAHDVLGERVVAVTARSASMPVEEADAARALAKAIGARQIEVESKELEDPDYAANPSNRCFYCKSELFRITARIAEGAITLDGTNLDDLDDHRPGRLAAEQAGVRSPLVEAGLDKETIRRLSKELGLPTWDKPSAPCLASRIPHGHAVTEERLARIGDAERAVRALGFRAFRVRWHDSVARLELDPSEMPRLADAELRARLSAAVKAAGFSFVAIDLDGYRRGSLNVLAT